MKWWKPVSCEVCVTQTHQACLTKKQTNKQQKTNKLKLRNMLQNTGLFLKDKEGPVPLGLFLSLRVCVHTYIHTWAYLHRSSGYRWLAGESKWTWWFSTQQSLPTPSLNMYGPSTSHICWTWLPPAYLRWALDFLRYAGFDLWYTNCNTVLWCLKEALLARCTYSITPHVLLPHQGRLHESQKPPCSILSGNLVPIKFFCTPECKGIVASSETIINDLKMFLVLRNFPTYKSIIYFTDMFCRKYVHKSWWLPK